MLTSRDTAGPVGVAAIVSILSPVFFVFTRFFCPFCYVWTPMVKLPPLRVLPRKKILNKMWMRRTQRSTVLGANWRLAKIQELHAPGNNPDAACTCEMHRNDGEKKQCCILSILEIKANQLLLCEWSYDFCRADSISWFVLRTQRAVLMLDDMLALANSVCLLVLSRSGRHVLVLLLCAELIAPCCAVFAVHARQHARTH